MIDVLHGKEHQHLGSANNTIFEDYVLRKMTAWYERYPPRRVRRVMGTKRAGRTRTMPAMARTVLQWPEVSDFVACFCTLREPKNLRPCENSMHDSRLFDSSNVLLNLIPLVTA